MAVFPKVKLKALPVFPAQVISGTGISIANNAGTYTISVDLSSTSTLDIPVSHGGTGVVALSAHGLVVGQGTSPVTTVSSSVGTGSLPLVSQGVADPIYTTLNVVGGGTGLNTVTNHGLVVGRGVGNLATITGSGGNSSFPLVSQGSSADPAYITLGVGGGGTGANTFTAHGVLLGQGTGNVTTLNGTSGNSSLPLISQGASLDPIYSAMGSAGLSANAVTNAKLDTMAAWTFKANNTSGTAVPTDVTIHGLTLKASPVAADEVIIWDVAGSAIKKATASSLATIGSVTSIAGNTGAFTLANGIENSTNQIQLTAARRTLPTTQVFITGSGTYTTPANCLWIEVELVGAGGGGTGSGTSFGSGGAGGATSFGSSLLTAGGGNSTGGGLASGGFLNKAGVAGGAGSGLNSTAGGNGAVSPYGGAGAGGAAGAGTGVDASANTGSGGGGGGVNTTPNGGAGGGSGGFIRAIINSPSATYAYAIGAGGTAGTAGTGGAAGGVGGSGFIQVIEHYGS